MVLPVKRWFAVAFLHAIAISQEAASAADAWKIIKVRGSDYLSVENVSQFYGLPAGIAASAEKWNSIGEDPLEFVSGSREVMINGARSWCAFRLSNRMESIWVSRTDVARPSTLVRPHRVQSVGKVQTVVSIRTWRV